MAFSKLKAHLRRLKARRLDDLCRAVGNICGLFDPTECWNDFKAAGYAHDETHKALGFWHALREVFGATKEQRGWFHKTGTVLNAMPKSVQVKAKGHQHDISLSAIANNRLPGNGQAETRVDAEAAFDVFVST